MSGLVRSDAEVAVNEVARQLDHNAQCYEWLSEAASCPAQQKPWLQQLSQRLTAAYQQLAERLVRHDDLPRAASPEAVLIDEWETLVAGNEPRAVQVERHVEQLQRKLLKQIDTALDQSLPEDERQVLQRLQRSVTELSGPPSEPTAAKGKKGEGW